MRINMADNNLFNIGSTITCTTCYQQKIEGEVLAFDYSSKMLAIKSIPASGKVSVYDVRLLNLNYCNDVKVIKEGTEPHLPLPQLNLQKLANRAKQNIEEKKRIASWVGVGVTPEAQCVFNAIVKTINEVKWDGKNIVVMDEVTIRPPYGLEDCRAKEGSLVMQHVKKILSKFLNDSDGQDQI